MNDIVDRIANGQATLLGIEDICTRLGISRTTFDRWVRNGSPRKSSLRELAAGKSLDSTFHAKSIAESIAELASNNTDGGIKFPPPDIRIGNSPKWEIETFKRWLTANVHVDG